MSDRQSLAMTEDEVATFLAGQRRAQVATINVDGTPHLVPLAYVLIDGRLTFWTDPHSRKVVNLRRDPRLTCLVEAGDHFAEFRAVQVSGHAELGEDAATSERVGLALFERAAGQLNDKLRATVAALVSERVAVTVFPERLVTWDHRKVENISRRKIGH